MKRKPDLPITLDRAADVSLQEQLYSALRKKLQSGGFVASEPLPSTRDLAQKLSVSRNTVIAAYDRLLGEGYLESHPRSGIFISSGLALESLQRTPSAMEKRKRVTSADQERVLRGPSPFRPSQPDVRLFPLATWNRLRSRALRTLGSGILHYQSRFALGLPTLRQALADYLFECRGVRCDWTQLAITSGSQQALYLLSQLLLRAGDAVYLEDPGYRGARLAFECARAKICAMPVDHLGALVPKRLKNTRAVYVTPSRQYPTGACMPVSRRLEFLDATKAADAWLIEDDYDSEFRYSQAPLPSLHSLDPAARVVYLGSMSKVLFPSLRIGYIVLPPELVQPFESLRLVVDDHGPLIDQAALAEFIVTGEFYKHVRRCRKEYASRLDAFLQAARRFGLPLTFPFTDGGMNQTGFFEDTNTNSEFISQRLLQRGLLVPSTEYFSIKRTMPGLVFGFTAFDQRTIQASLEVVAQELERCPT